MFRRGPENRPTLRSWLRNRLYRKAPERTPGEFARLFAYVRDLHAHAPDRIPALVPLSGLAPQMVLLEFHDPLLRVYSGLEIIVFDEARYLYYRLPGAKPNGEGNVVPGTYR